MCFFLLFGCFAIPQNPIKFFCVRNWIFRKSSLLMHCSLPIYFNFVLAKGKKTMQQHQQLYCTANCINSIFYCTRRRKKIQRLFTLNALNSLFKTKKFNIPFSVSASIRFFFNDFSLTWYRLLYLTHSVFFSFCAVMLNSRWKI